MYKTNFLFDEIINNMLKVIKISTYSKIHELNLILKDCLVLLNV